MVNKIVILMSLFLLTSCTSIRYVETDHGHIITDRGQPVNIIGNPRLTCFNQSGEVIADGFFVRQLDDGSFVIDEFGFDYLIVNNPLCQLNSNEAPQEN
jgi:hypothetical protein